MDTRIFAEILRELRDIRSDMRHLATIHVRVESDVRRLVDALLGEMRRAVAPTETEAPMTLKATVVERGGVVIIRFAGGDEEVFTPIEATELAYRIDTAAGAAATTAQARAEPSRAEPSRAEPSQAEPSQAEP